MADMNQDVWSDEIGSAFADIALREVLVEHHGENLPFTCHNGSEPVGGTWAMPGTRIEKGGMLPFGKGMPGSDHCMTWIDISHHTTFGNIPPKALPSPAQRL